MRRWLGIAGGVAAALYSSAAAADTISVSLEARVETFCRVYPPDRDVIDVRGGFASIGIVREICNTPEGYDVRTSFSNVTSARLLVGQASYAVVDGVATRSSTEPAVRSEAWSLASATLESAERPVVMRVTISPR